MSKKLSKSNTAERLRAGEAVQAILSELTDAENKVVLSEAVGAIIDSDWLREERRAEFWSGVHALGDLVGADDYTLHHIIDPYEEKKKK